MTGKFVPEDAIVLEPGDPVVQRFINANGFDDTSAGEVARLIAGQISPPKPAEPTEFGAMVRDRDGVTWLRWVYHGHHPWINNHGGNISAYVDIDVIEVLR
jgi:hypothetical protein